VPPFTAGSWKVSLLLAPLGQLLTVGAGVGVGPVLVVVVAVPAVVAPAVGGAVGTGHAGTLKVAGDTGADGVPALFGHGDSGFRVRAATWWVGSAPVY
jgi:hypothetical protein